MLVMFKIGKTGLLKFILNILSVQIILCQISKRMSRDIVNLGAVLGKYWLNISYSSLGLINDLAHTLR